MKINIQDRIALIKILPKSGSIADLLICKELNEKFIYLSDEYKEKISYKDENGIFHYDVAKDESIDFDFSESEKHVLKSGVALLDKQELITSDILDMCLKVKDL